MSNQRRSSFGGGPNAMSEHLQKCKIADFLPERKDGLIVVYDREKLESVVDVLASNKILSVPVLDERNECLGFLDVVTIAAYVSDAAPDIMDGLPGTSSRKIKDVSLRSLIDHGHLTPTPYTAIRDTDTLYDLALKLCSHSHRVAIYTDDITKLVNMVSQSDVARFVDQHLNDTPALKAMGSKTLSELGCHSHRALGFVSANEPVVLALQSLVRHKWSALAIIDDHGQLVGNFSPSDLRGLYKNQFPHFLTSVREFLRKFSPGSLEMRTVTLDTTFAQAVNTLVNTKVHRLWVIRDNKPVSVLTLTDIMKIVSGQPL